MELPKHKIKSLFISQDGMTDHLGQSQVIPYLQGLSANGVEVHLLSLEKPSAFKNNGENIAQILKSSGINWYPTEYKKGNPIISSIWHLIILYRKAFALHRLHQINVVHCRSYLTAIIGEKMQKKFGVKFLFDIRGFWPDERVDGGLWKLNNPVFKLVYNYFKKKEKLFFETADAIVSLTESAKIHITKSYKIKGEIVVIPCAADLSIFKPQSNRIRTEYRAKLGIKDEFVLLYLGSIGTWYLLNEMLDFFAELKKVKLDAKFVFITGDSPLEIIKNAEIKGLNKKDIIIQKASRNEVVLYLSTADASIFFIKPCFSKMASSPTKHGEILGTGIPFIANEIGDLKLISNWKNSGILIDEFTIPTFHKAIELLAEKIDQQAFIDTAQEFYSLEKGQKKYFNLYLFLVGQL